MFIQSLADDWRMYLLCGSVVLLVLAQAIFFLVRAYREGKKIGMEKGVLNKAITSSLVFSILPSISILVGVFALAGSLGIQLPWMRLSVIGALHYEISAAEVALQASTGKTDIHLTASLGDLLDAQMFATIAFIMTIAILGGVITVLLFYHKIDKGVKKVTTKNPKIGNVIFSGMFIGLICTYVSTGFSSLIHGLVTMVGDTEKTVYTPIPIIAMASSFVVAFILYLLGKKFPKANWIKTISVAASMLIGMGVAMICGACVPEWRF